MSENSESQKLALKKAFLNGQRLTCLDILYQFKCMNAKGRIHDLRREGLPIKTEMKQTRHGKRVGVYFIETKKILA